MWRRFRRLRRRVAHLRRRCSAAESRLRVLRHDLVRVRNWCDRLRFLIAARAARAAVPRSAVDTPLGTTGRLGLASGRATTGVGDAGE